MEQEMENQHMQYESPPSQVYEQGDGKADLLDKIRPEEAVEQIKYNLMGYEMNHENGKWEKNNALSSISLSPVGATAIANLIFTASTRTVSISNLKDDEIKKRLLSIIRTAMKMCLDNWTEYGIKSTADFFLIREVIHTNTLAALKQSENEGIRRMLNSTIQENRSVSTYGEEKKRGGIAGLLRR